MSFLESLQVNEVAIRLSSFFGICFLIIIFEVLAPRRKRVFSRAFRWSHNLGLVFLTTILMRLLIWVPPVIWAQNVEEKSWGLLHQIQLPEFVEVLLAVVVLDMVIYFQHVFFHKMPLLWRLHRMHHADVDYDFTLGSRFHPIEIFLSLIIKFTAIAILGPQASAVVLFEIILNAMAVFNHGNYKIPLGLDKILRLVIVTPDFHRVHHSSDPRETHQNYGFNLSLWDRLFKTYTPQPRRGHEKMEIGLKKFRNKKNHTIWGLLKLPFQ